VGVAVGLTWATPEKSVKKPINMMVKTFENGSMENPLRNDETNAMGYFTAIKPKCSGLNF
jgi:hypothetical protein